VDEASSDETAAADDTGWIGEALATPKPKTTNPKAIEKLKCFILIVFLI
jgi:hypothetical protein